MVKPTSRADHQCDDHGLSPPPQNSVAHPTAGSPLTILGAQAGHALDHRLDMDLTPRAELAQTSWDATLANSSANHEAVTRIFAVDVREADHWQLRQTTPASHMVRW